MVMKKKEVEENYKRIEELEKCGTAVGEDKVIMKKQKVQAMKNVIVEFEKVSNGESDHAKMVAMNKKQMLIGIEHYNDMRKKCKVVGEDEVGMKKKEVEEKDQRIEELEKCGGGITEDELS